jgi:autotransporter-associated beta strand protein
LYGAGGIERLESRVLLSGTPAIPLSNTTWTPIGPAPSANGNIAGNGPISGRVTGIAADPTNANVIYLASAGGGVWKTVNGGSSWSPLTDTQSTLFMGAIAVAPTNPNIIYAATGDATNSSTSYYGRGILKSTNGGASWVLLGNNVFNRKTFAQIVVDPTNPNIVYGAVAGGGTNGTSGGTGIWKTTDGGSTWTNTTSAISTTDRFTDVAIDSLNPQHLFCARSGGAGTTGIYVTFNGGASWSLVGGLPSGPGLAQPRVSVSASNPQVIYASFPSGNFHLLGIWRSGDGGVNWSQLPDVPDYLDGNAFYSTTLTVDPNAANTVYAGGVAGLLRSADGGQTWTNIIDGSDGTTGAHWDHHAEAFDANGRLLDGSDGGIWRLENSTPGSITWGDLNTNLQISTFLDGAIDPTDPNNAFAVGQDNALTQFSGSTTWTQRDIGPGPDRGVVLINPQNPNRVYQQVDKGEAGADFIRRSDDGGSTWVTINNGIDRAELQSAYAGFALDPSNGNHLVYGTDRVYESYDGGDTWAPISTPNTNGWTVNSTVTISHLAIAATDPHTVYATIAGHVFVTNNGGGTWVQRDPFNSSFGGLVVDPNNANVAFTLGGQFGVQKVMRTTDGGVTWKPIGGFLPDLPTYTLVDNNGTLYVGNDNGVYTSTDDGGSWGKLGIGMPNVEVRDLEFNPATSTLAAFTYGRGAWQISTAPSASLVVSTLLDETNPDDGLLSLREAVAAADSTGQAVLLDPSLAGGTINLDPANGALVVNRSGVVITAPAGNVTINTNGYPVEAAGNNTIRLNNFSFSSSGGPALQIDSQTLLLIQNPGSTADIVDNGRLSVYSYADGQISGAVSGSGLLNKLGAYTLRLTGNNSYTGQTTVAAGMLVGSTAILKGNLFLNGGVLAFDQSSLPGNDGFFSGTVVGNGTVRVLGPSSIVRLGTFGTGFSTMKNSGQTTIDPGAMLVANSANNLSIGAWDVEGTFDMGGFDQTLLSLTGAGSIYNLTSQANPLATLTVGNAVNTTFSGVIEDSPSGLGNPGVVALKKVSSSTLTLAGTAGRASTYTGGTTVSAGALQGNTLGLQGNIVDGSSSILLLTIDQSLGGLNDGVFHGTVSGFFDTRINGGTVRLAPGSALNEAIQTTLNGTLVAGAPNQFGGLAQFVVNGTLDLGGFDQHLNVVLGGGTVLNNTTAGQPGLATLSLGGATFTGVIEDHTPGNGSGGMLALNTLGTARLTGDNSYSGGTTIVGAMIVGPSVGDPLGTGPVVMAGGSISLLGRITTPLEQVIPVTGFNQDVIVDASAGDTVSSTTTPVDNPSAGGSYVWYEKGFGGTAAQGTGLAAGTTFLSPADPDVPFQLQPANGNNVAMLTGSDTVDLVLSQPGHFSSLHLLASSANGQGGLFATLHFSDGTSSQNSVFNVPDWFDGANPALIAGGRILRAAGAPVVLTPGDPRMYQFDINLGISDEFKVLTGITLSESGGHRIGVYAVSGAGFDYLPTQNYSNTVRVNADTALDIENSPTVTFGDLTIGANALNVTGAGTSLAFSSVHLAGDHVFDVPAGQTMTLGAVSDGGAGYATGLTDSGTLVFAGTNSYGGATPVNGGTLVASSAGAFPAQTRLTITGNGVVRFPSAGPAFTATLASLSVDPGSKLDLGNKALWVNYGANPDPLATIQTYLKTGYDAGNWDGLNSAAPSGAIVSTAAATDPRKSTAVGYRDVTTALRNGVPAHTLWLSYTLYGDANLDGTVNLLDAVPVILNYGKTGRRWDQGDFNYDGTVNLADAQALAANFGMSTPVTPAAQATAAVQAVPSGGVTLGKSKYPHGKHRSRHHAHPGA